MESIVSWGFNLHAWITIATVLTMFTILLFTKLRADLVFMGAVGILFVTGVLDAKEAFSGFSSGSVVVIGVLFAVMVWFFVRKNRELKQKNEVIIREIYHSQNIIERAVKHGVSRAALL